VFYSLLKIYARLAIKLYCRKVIINQPEMLEKKGPVLFAANHPNSFLDGIILTTLHEFPLHSLARGDAFKNKPINSFLRKLQLLPVYRASEGVENLEQNYTTFEACIKTFDAGENVLIFSEGRCVNEWHLRPLKKGTARLTNTAWQKGIPLEVIPLGINYSSFKKFGKEVHLLFGEPILKAELNHGSEGKFHLELNSLLSERLKTLVYEIDENDKEKRRKIFSIKKKMSLLFFIVPGIIGLLAHMPLYLPVKIFAEIRFKTSGHYDSVVTTLLLLFYPFYLLMTILILLPIFGSFAFGVLLIMPLLAKCTLETKYQLDL
jgi:1-acyl-sn-glycerol-3-phosphate acyltransferase